MATEEEFNQVQEQLVEIGQQNFALKEDLDRLLAANKKIPKLKQQLSDLEKEKDTLRRLHEKEMKELSAQLEEAKKKVSEEADNQTKMLAAKATEMTHQLADVMKRTKEKEDEVRQLEHQVATHKSDVKRKTEKLHKLRAKAREFIPFLSFLRNAMAVPMYIEDMSVKITNLRRQREEEDEALAKLDQDVTDLHKLNDDLARKIKSKAAELNEYKAKLKNTKGRIVDTKAEINRTRTALEQTEQRLQSAQESGRQLAQEVEARLKKVRDERTEVDAVVAEKLKQRDEAQQELDGMKAETDKELEQHSAKIQDLRNKLSSIKETGDDGDGTRVDNELQHQIHRIMEEKTQLNDQILMLKQAIDLVEEEIRQKGLEVQRIAMRMDPTAKIISQPDFEQKQLLFEELVLQNRELRTTFGEMTERVVQLRKENTELRKQINGKSKQ